MGRLVLVRHGQSVWNERGLCTGWVDIPLSVRGMEEAKLCAEKLKNHPIDRIFTSSLVRTVQTALVIMEGHSSKKIPYIVHEEEPGRKGWFAIRDERVKQESIELIKAEALNERMYGDLQGLSKNDLALKYGKEQLQKWRRGYDTAPPHGESLQMTSERVLPFFKKEILARAETGENLVVVAHGNSLRAIVMELEKLSPEEVFQLEIATGEILAYGQTEKGWVRRSLDGDK